MTRICFLNTFGTDRYDELIRSTLEPYLRPETEVDIAHLTNCPRNLDYFVPKHLVEVEVLRAVLAADRAGFDAFVIGCCYDPGLTQARELTDMPVVAALEAAEAPPSPSARCYRVPSDHWKPVPSLEDRPGVYAPEP